MGESCRTKRVEAQTEDGYDINGIEETIRFKNFDLIVRLCGNAKRATAIDKIAG